jgi:hypothetical protein
MKILTMLMMLVFVACSSSGEPRDAGDGNVNGDYDYDYDHDHDYDKGDEDGGEGIWGWISILESEDTYTNEPGGWETGPRALFAEGPCCFYVLEQHLEHCGNLLASGGGCSLYKGFWLDVSSCEPDCQEGQECVDEGGNLVCRDLPAKLEVGQIDIGGLKVSADLAVGPNGIYTDSSVPDDMFDAGDAITAEVSGDGLAPISLAASGVNPPEIASNTLDLIRGSSATVSWTPAEPGTKIQVFLSGGSHYPHLYFATVLCEASDEQGSLEIPAEVVDGFLDVVVGLGIRRYSRIVRTTGDVVTHDGKDVELYVGSARNIQLVVR